MNKEQVKNEIKAYIKKKFGDRPAPLQVMNDLPEMYRHLREKNMIPEGFQQFEKSAQEGLAFAVMMKDVP